MRLFRLIEIDMVLVYRHGNDSGFNRVTAVGSDPISNPGRNVLRLKSLADVFIIRKGQYIKQILVKGCALNYQGRVN